MATTNNTLSGLVPTIYTALDIVARELIGFIPNVSVDASASAAAKGQTVRAHVAPAVSASDITPGATADFDGGQTIGYTDVEITKSRKVEVLWNGEEQLSLGPSGTYNRVLTDQFAQGFRALANEVESDLGGLYKKATGATGTPGATPFATAQQHTDFAEANRILDELGAPASDRIMVMGSAARAKLEGLHYELFKVNEAGDAGAMLRNRIQRQLHGFNLGYSAGIKSHTKTDDGAYVSDGGSAKGDTTIKVKTGSNGFAEGDLIQMGGAGPYYVAGGWTSPNITLRRGIEAALVATTGTVKGADYTANLFYHKSALLLASRAPAMPVGGDNADDVMTVTDPVSGLAFQIALYRMYRAVKFEIGLAWGVAAPNNKYLGILAG